MVLAIVRSAPPPESAARTTAVAPLFFGHAVLERPCHGVGSMWLRKSLNANVEPDESRRTVRLIGALTQSPPA